MFTCMAAVLFATLLALTPMLSDLLVLTRRILFNIVYIRKHGSTFYIGIAMVI